MTDKPARMTFHVESRRVDARGSFSRCTQAEIALDTDMAGNPEAINPGHIGTPTISDKLEHPLSPKIFMLGKVKNINELSALMESDGACVPCVQYKRLHGKTAALTGINRAGVPAYDYDYPDFLIHNQRFNDRPQPPAILVAIHLQIED